MTPYYAWAALAVGVAVAARCSARRFGIAIGLAVATTVTAQWIIAWFPWWAIQVTGLTALLAVTYAPASLQVARAKSGPERKRVPAGVQQGRASGTDKQGPGRVSATKQSGSKSVNTPRTGASSIILCGHSSDAEGGQEREGEIEDSQGYEEVTEHQTPQNRRDHQHPIEANLSAHTVQRAPKDA